METRTAVLAAVADDVLALPSTQWRRVAVDGVDGAGKTVFADELADALARKRASVIRASVDGFHNPREIRYRRGRGSPQGFFRDSYDYAQLIALLLRPLGRGGCGRFVRRIYDVDNETPVPHVFEQAEPGSILVLDGIFLHRDELVGFWDYSIWLHVPFDVAIPRGARRGTGFSDPDPAAASNRRYVEGQRLYLSTCEPLRRATVVIDNTDLGKPRRHRVEAVS
jgi:uridine kinase